MVVKIKYTLLSLWLMGCACHQGVDKQPPVAIDAASPDSVILNYLKDGEYRDTREESIVRIKYLIDSLAMSGNDVAARRIYGIYKRVYSGEIPLAYWTAAPVAILDGLSDDTDTSVVFDQVKDGPVQLYAVGEGMYNIKSSIVPPWFSDNAEIFFDMKNNKFTHFDRNSDDRQYFFTWHRDGIAGGQNADPRGVECKQADPSATEYTMEIAFPWKTLGYVTPANGLAIGFDILLDDNDSSDLEAQVTWHGPTGQLSNNTSLYGTLQLKTRGGVAGKPGDTAFSGHTDRAPRIDGVEDVFWRDAPVYTINRLVTGAVQGPDDIRGTFRSLWDNDNLYLFLTVTDDKKRQASALFDYGWIEDSAGKRVWTMDVKATKHAGGAVKNRLADTVIFLNKGRYRLRYLTDNSHAYGQWDDRPPKLSLYGIALYNKKDSVK